MSFLLLFGSVILLLGFAFTRSRVKALKLSRLSFEELLARLEPVPSDGISAVALDYLQPVQGQLKLETDQIWSLVGKKDGLRRMYANAGVLLALAGYAQRWNPVEGAIVAERMRRDGITLRRASLRLSLSSIARRGETYSLFNVQEVASSYFLMRARLLALYQTSHAGRYPVLLATL